MRVGYMARLQNVRISRGSFEAADPSEQSWPCLLSGTPIKPNRILKKHGVSFKEASTVFADPLARTIHDPLHSEDEDRFVNLGESDRGRLLVVVFINRGDRIRIISARGGNSSREKRL